jgi:hypothetical protein
LVSFWGYFFLLIWNTSNFPPPQEQVVFIKTTDLVSVLGGVLHSFFILCFHWFLEGKALDATTSIAPSKKWSSFNALSIFFEFNFYIVKHGGG